MARKSLAVGKHQDATKAGTEENYHCEPADLLIEHETVPFAERDSHVE